MLHFYRFAQSVPEPAPAREVYETRKPGKGWPEECPPLRAANAFGWDILAAFDMRFEREGEGWRLANPVDVDSDWVYSPGPEVAGGAGDAAGEETAEGAPLTQRNAWFWDEGQELPHRITPEVYAHLRHQVKVSTFLFLRTDPNELLYMTDVPNRSRPYRALSALLETDWYPASYPWHCVLELAPERKVIEIAKGEPICRLFLVRRDTYFAQEMSPAEFERLFERGQTWLARHGRGEDRGMLDITGTYVRQRRLSRFDVIL